MLGVGAGAPAPPLVRAPPLVVAPRLPPFFSFPLRRRGRTAAAAAAKQNQGRRRWWSDSDQEEYEEEEEYDDFFPGGSLGGELFDEPWFSKVFKTYGYLLPVMLASMLVATGPRAFLMAMAIPLGQSAISFLLDAIWGRNGRRRQSPFEEEYEEEEEDFPKYSSDFASASGRDRSSSNSYYGQRRRQSYQSWVSDDFVADADDYSSNDRGGGPKTSSGFGGWDELLDKDDDAAQVRNKASSRPTTDDAARGPGAPLSRKRARMSASTKYKQAPMLMRLLVAVFPFLGSWFRLL